MASDAVAVAVASGTAGQLIQTGASTLFGWSLGENAGAVAKAYIRDGVDTSGTIVAVIRFLANGSSVHSISPRGIRCKTGIYLDKTTTTIEGAIFVG